MKKFNKLFLTFGLVAAFGLSSCINDLDQVPKDQNSLTSEKFKEDPEGYMNAVLAECYLSFATTGTGGASGSANIQGFDGGMGTFQRAVFNLNEIPTDEADWLSVSDSHMNASVQYCVFPANNACIYGTYSRLTINASVCNEFIRTVQNGKFGLPEELKEKAENYCNQARVLRSLAYFYLIDLFGNVPYADETLAAGAVPPQYTRAEAYAKVVADLEAASAALPDADPAYGYVGKDAADALLAKFYLNAGVFTGTPQYQKCWDKCQEIIKRHQGGGFEGSGLANSYTGLFAANNDKYAAGGSNKAENELIWIIPCDGENLTSYAGSSFLINAWVTAATSDSEWQIQPSEYNMAGSGWKCMLARKQFVEKFDWNDDGTSPDLRTALWKTSADGFKLDNTGMIQGDYGNGFVAVKYTNFAYDNDGNIDFDNSPSPADFSNADVAVIRLAEIYLTAAECNVVGNVGDASAALEYVNLIRRRAGLENWTLTDLTADNLLDERCRELYQENCRRTDLVRFNKFTGSAYIWNFKGGVKDGTSIASTLNLYPIPDTVVKLAGYTQNPGY
ncbi:MAG: RagB/SusD family nutrient uptake outer membrane protein [Muribaculaceae bacterium]|nr:RagB/SusD family nutrient uptake outer membrane protein [Muribaculaceae bacterium]